MAQDSKCGKMVRNYPRSIDPCIQADLAQKRENAKRKLAAAAPRSSSGKILSKSVQLKSAARPPRPINDVIDDVIDDSAVEKKPLPPSAFDVLGTDSPNATQSPMGVTRPPISRIT